MTATSFNGPKASKVGNISSSLSVLGIWIQSQKSVRNDNLSIVVHFPTQEHTRANDQAPFRFGKKQHTGRSLRIRIEMQNALSFTMYLGLLLSLSLLSASLSQSSGMKIAHLAYKEFDRIFVTSFFVIVRRLAGVII